MSQVPIKRSAPVTVTRTATSRKPSGGPDAIAWPFSGNYGLTCVLAQLVGNDRNQEVGRSTLSTPTPRGAFTAERSASPSSAYLQGPTGPLHSHDVYSAIGRRFPVQ